MNFTDRRLSHEACPRPRSLPFVRSVCFIGWPPAASAGSQTIVRAAEQQSAPVNPANFTGAARSDGAFRQQAPARVYGGWVTFEPGSRTHWHIHPLGQTLIVTFGAGLTQVEGGPVREIRAGDIVICPPGGKHWHGAKPNQAMQHIAIGERAENEQVQWLEEVSDEIYLQPVQAPSIK